MGNNNIDNIINKVAVLGGGAWGTALATVAAIAGREVTIFSRNRDVVENINKHHENPRNLNNIKLSDNIKASDDFSQLDGYDLIIITTSSQYFKDNLKYLHSTSTKPVIIACKGIDHLSLKLMHELFLEYFPAKPVALLSGPNFAVEIIKQLPAVTTISSHDNRLNDQLIFALSSSYFRIYPNNDMVSTAIVGATKNILAIASGICIGKELGENARAALITRGISEITSLCVAKGGKADSMLSPAGIGDIILTCGSMQSRNTKFGFDIATGKTIAEAMTDKNNQSITIEGYISAKSIILLAKQLDITLPIFEAVYKVLYRNKTIDEEIDNLLNRPVVCKNN